MNDTAVNIPTVSVIELAKIMADQDVFLLDVREANEVAMASIKGAKHISMNEITDRLDELPKDKTLYVFCHHGGRSAMVCQYLQKQGYDCKNINGGIHQYALQVDNSIATY